MKLGVVSDTHGNLKTAAAAVQQLSQYEIDAVLHCGDIVGAGIIPLFAAWPTHFVFGNCDYDLAEMRRTIQDCGQFCHERFGELTFGGRSIALLHGDDSRLLRESQQSGRFDLVCSGHTHVYEERRAGGTLILNPGALHRASVYTCALVDLLTLQVQRIEIHAAPH